MLIISATNRSMLDHPEQILYNPRSAGPLAQWLEQATHNRLVAGSNPAGATKFINKLAATLRRSKISGDTSGMFQNTHLLA